MYIQSWLPPATEEGGDTEKANAEEFNPRDASRYIIAVADAAGWLFANSDPPHFDLTIAVVDQERELFLEYGCRAADGLAEITDDPAPDLLFEAMSKKIPSEQNKAAEELENG